MTPSLIERRDIQGQNSSKFSLRRYFSVRLLSSQWKVTAPIQRDTSTEETHINVGVGRVLNPHRRVKRNITYYRPVLTPATQGAAAKQRLRHAETHHAPF